MNLRRITFIVPLMVAVHAFAAINASWRVNPISSAAISVSPSLAKAVSLSLMLETDAGSLWDYTSIAFRLAPGLGVYNHPTFGSDSPPNPALVAVFPDLAFDSYFVGSQRGSHPVPPPATGFVWGPPPQIGSGEILRMTILNAQIGTSDPFPIGEVREINPLADPVPLPMPPIVGVLPVPEPATFGMMLLALPSRRRRF